MAHTGINTDYQSYLFDGIHRIMHGQHHDPHNLLGLHEHPSGDRVVHIYRPGADKIYAEVKRNVVEATRIHDAGFFEVKVPKDTASGDYKIYHHSGLLAHDPYAYAPSISDLDLYLFGTGVHYEAYRILGARLTEHHGVKGVRFAVWAPSARTVSVIGDFNHWDGRVNPMRSMGSGGVWELFVPGIEEGVHYKFEIHAQDGERLIKADPYAFATEHRPRNASVVAEVDRFQWSDHRWMEQRQHRHQPNQPMNVYEVHLTSWRRPYGNWLGYRELAHQLAEYCNEMGFTHVELMPIAEHPLDESWGYQVTGFYSVTSRHGSPEDFQYFVNHLHQHNIGVIVDWVPGHFPCDDFSLARFDGTHLYEHADPKQGFHPHWSTSIFNFGRREVSNFLIANALFWLEIMHVDALRVDAVASMLYLDYGREHGEWIPNVYGGKENLEAIEFLRHMNSIVHQRCPGALTIAEESTAFGGVTCPVEYDGLGFDLKWNMGWMNDTLRYFSKDSIYRSHHHNDLTFGLLYAFTERFALVLSHDEVVHGKQSLLAKMPGDYWQKFANLRLLLSYMTCQPGKKLLFMGGELGQWNEWDCNSEIDWVLLSFPMHDGLKTMVKELNHFYLQHPSLWERDHTHEGFEWVGLTDHQNSVVSYLRKGENSLLLCVHNATPTFHEGYVVAQKNVATAREVFNSDDERYGGSGKRNEHIDVVYEGDYPSGIRVNLAPLATMIFELDFCS